MREFVKKCWRKELKNNFNNQNENIKNKMSRALQNYVNIILVILTFIGIGLSIDANSLYPLIATIIIGIGQYFFFCSIAEIIQKLQNIQDSIK